MSIWYNLTVRNGLFDRTYVINLASRPERLERTKALLDSLGVEFQRFEAHRFAKEPLTIWNYWVPVGCSAMYGCLLSHLDCLRGARQDGLDDVLIFEDDIKPESGYLELRSYIDDLKSVEWDMFYLYPADAQGQSPVPKTRLRRLPGVPWRTHAYAVSCRYLNRLIQILETNQSNVLYPLDTLYRQCVDGRVYAPDRALFGQYTESDIGR